MIVQNRKAKKNNEEEKRITQKTEIKEENANDHTS